MFGPEERENPQFQNAGRAELHQRQHNGISGGAIGPTFRFVWKWEFLIHTSFEGGGKGSIAWHLPVAWMKAIPQDHRGSG